MENSHISFTFGGRPEETGRWPFRLAVLAELLPRVYETGKPDARAFRAAVDKDTLSQAMAKAGLRICFNLNNPLAEQPREWHLDFAIEDLKSFRPENIVEIVPELKDLAAARTLLSDLTQRKLTMADFREQIRAYRLPAEVSENIVDALFPAQKKPERPAPPPGTPKKPQPEGEGKYTLDAILEMVDTPDETRERGDAREKARTALDDFLGPGRPTEEAADTGAAQKAIAHVDHLLGQAVNAIVHHPEFQRVEAVWRGVKFLVDQTDFRKGVRLEIIHTDKEHLREVFARDIYQTEYDEQSEIPLAAVVAVFEFDASAPDIELLRELAQKASELPLAVVTSAGASFFGLNNATELTKLPYLGSLLDRPEYVKFCGLRAEPTSCCVTLCFNRFLMRYPYGYEGWRVKSFDFKESTATETDFLWGNPVWALAALMTRSYGRVGWATQISGRRNGGVVENQPVRSLALPGGDSANLPLETHIPDRRLEEFDRSGIIPLLCDINSDAFYVLATPTVHRPAHNADPAKAERNAFAASLPYQMYVGEIARFINRRQAEFTSGFDPGEIEARFSRALEAFNVARDEPGDTGVVRVQVQDSATRPGKKELAIQISSPKRVLHGRAGTELTLPLRA